MNKTRKKSTSRTDSLLRGLIAISVCAALLAAGLFFLIPKAPESKAPSQTQEPRDTMQEPPAGILPANPYGPEDFEYQGEYLACTAGAALLGVDVSAHQGQIDWEQVADAGMEFAIVRIGYRGYTSGGIYIDEYARENLDGARAAGLKVGAYFYSQAINATEAALEAAYCISFLEDQQLDLPLVYDWEFAGEDTRSAGMDRETLMDCTRTFCDAVAEAGYEPMIYFNPHVAEDLLVLEELTAYPFWLAMYSSQMTWPYQVEMWQYTATGSVPGIEGEADINLWFVG